MSFPVCLAGMGFRAVLLYRHHDRPCVCFGDCSRTGDIKVSIGKPSSPLAQSPNFHPPPGPPPAHSDSDSQSGSGSDSDNPSDDDTDNGTESYIDDGDSHAGDTATTLSTAQYSGVGAQGADARIAGERRVTRVLKDVVTKVQLDAMAKRLEDVQRQAVMQVC